MSKEHEDYLRKIKRKRIIITISQISILLIFLLLWESLTKYSIINPFIYSSPSRIINTIINLINNNLFIHILTTLKEIIISFILGIFLGFIISIILYEFNTFYKIIDPFLTILNSLPKVALGPLIIILFGANTKSIIIMALLINLITSTLSIYNGFCGVSLDKLKLFKSLNATKYQALKYLIIPSSYQTIISSFKICISQTLVGVIMGEFLVSKEGIGYLIVYGKQVFNLNLVMSGIILLAILSFILYKITILLEKKLIKYN